MSTSPVMTRAELDVLARTPTEQVVAAIASGEAVQLRRAVEDIERRFRGGLRGSRDWEHGTIDAILEQPDGPARVAEFTTTTSWTVAALNGVTTEDLAMLSTRHGEELESVMERHGADAALERYRALEDSYRRLRDSHSDTTAALWTILYELAGSDGLTSCFRTLADRTLMLWMTNDITLSPEQLIREWSSVFTANFARIHIDELEDRFRVVQDPCGTCTRQVRAGRYDAPLGLAVIPPFHPESSGPEPVPIYRSHVGLMHWILPLERIGTPWPTITCPAGAGTGPCRIDLMKDPSQLG